MISEAETLEQHDRELNHAHGLIMGLSITDGITPEEADELRNLINKHIDLYWDNAKNDLKSVHRRIFPEQ